MADYLPGSESITAFASRTLIGLGVLYLVDFPGLHAPMEQAKVAATVSAASVVSQLYVEPMWYAKSKPSPNPTL